MDSNENQEEEYGEKLEPMSVEDDEITKHSVFRQLYLNGAYPLLILLLLDWIAKSAASKKKIYLKNNFSIQFKKKNYKKKKILIC